MWSWLRYWYLDSADFIALMLFDKGYYDYDYEPVKAVRKLTKEDMEIWSDDKVAAVLGRAVDPTTGKHVFEDADRGDGA